MYFVLGRVSKRLHAGDRIATARDLNIYGAVGSNASTSHASRLCVLVR